MSHYEETNIDRLEGSLENICSALDRIADALCDICDMMQEDRRRPEPAQLDIKIESACPPNPR